MAVTLPTVDDFTETTVLTMIRKVVDYLCSDSGLVAQINNNDITGFTSSYTNNLLKIDATKGDGTTIPVCSVTIEGGSSTGNPYPTGISGTVGADGNITFTVTMSSGSPLTTTINMAYFASADDLSDLQEQVTGIKPTVTTNLESSPPTITVAVNGTSSTANLPSTGSGSSEWEEIDLSNVPNDFSRGDTIKVAIKKLFDGGSGITNWNSTIGETPSLQIGTETVARIIEFTFTDGDLESIIKFPYSFFSNNGCIRIDYIRVNANINNFNNNESYMMQLGSTLFNSASITNTTGTAGNITRNNISDFIYKMWRKKA